MAGKNPAGITDEDLETLDQAEIDAIKALHEDDDDAEGDDTVAGGAGDDKDKDKGAGAEQDSNANADADGATKDKDAAGKTGADKAAGAEPGAADKDAGDAKAAQDTAAAAAAAAATTTDKQETAPVVATSTAPVQFTIDQQAVADAKKTLTTVEDAHAALALKLDKGEIDDTAFHAETRKLNQQQRVAEKVIDKAEMYADLNQRNVETAWNTATDRFLAAPQNSKLFDNDYMFDALQKGVNEVGKDPRFKQASPDQIIDEAGRRVKKAIGHPDSDADTGAGKQQDGEKTPAGKAEAARRLKDKGKQAAAIPPTLSDKTAAEDTDTTYTGKFAHLARLEGMDLEEALAALSEKDQLEYLTMAQK